MLETEQTTNTTDTTTEGTAPAKKTARKRATKKVTGNDTPSAGTEPAAAATTKKATARRSTAKKTEAAPASTGSAPVDAPATAAAASETAAPPVKKPARRATKKAAPPAESPFAATESPEPAPRVSRSARRVAAPAMLFQAPEPVAAPPAATSEAPTTATRRTRTRSASRTAGAPGHAEDVPRAASVDASADASTTSSGEAPAEPAPTRSRRTRSRSAAAADPSTETAASTSSRDRAVDAVAEVDVAPGDDRAQTTAEGALDGAAEPSSSSRRRRRGSRGRGRKPATSDDGDSETADTTDGSDDVEEPYDDTAAAAPTSRSSRSRSRSRSGGSKPAPGTEPDAGAADDDRSEPGRSAADDGTDDDQPTDETGSGSSSSRRRRRRRRSGDTAPTPSPDDPPQTVVKVRDARPSSDDAVAGVAGSTRLEAKKQRRRDGRDQARRRTPVLTEAEFLARREAVDRVMVVRQNATRTQIAVLEDGVLVEHYVTQSSQTSYVGNVYLGRVQNVLPAMEAAFIDIGKGRNGVLYAGEVAWSRLGLEGKPKRIESVLSSGTPVLVQVTKDPVAHKGARLTGMVSLPGRFLVYAPGGSMSGISRKLPENERNRLKSIVKKVFPDEASVIIRTAAEGASEEELTCDVKQLESQWNQIETNLAKASAPSQLYAEPDLAIKVVRDMFNEDVSGLVISGAEAWDTLHTYVGSVAPDLLGRVTRWESDQDVFAEYRVDEQIAKALDRKVWLPSGGSLVIDRTEAMTVVDVNTGKFTGSGGSLEETVTKNNLEAAEEIVRQIRLRDVGGIIVIDFIDMVLERNRDLVLRRLVECLGRDRTRHQVAEVTSLGLVQMTRKRVGVGLFEAFSETCEHCQGRGVHVHGEPIAQKAQRDDEGQNNRRDEPSGKKSKGSGGAGKSGKKGKSAEPGPDPANGRKATEVIKAIAAAASRAHLTNGDRPADEDAAAADTDTEIEVHHLSADTDATLLTEDVSPTDLSQTDPPLEPSTTKPKRRRVTRPAGAPA